MLSAADRIPDASSEMQVAWQESGQIAFEQMQPDRVLWILPMVSLIPDESLDRLKSRFGAEFSNSLFVL